MDMYPHPDGFIGGWWQFDKTHGVTDSEAAENLGLERAVSASGAALSQVFGDFGGALRTAVTANEGSAGSLSTPLMFRPDRGVPAVAEARLRVSNGGRSAFFFGFNDSNLDAVIAENEDGVLNTAGTDLVGIIYEGERTDAQGDRWVAVSTRNNADEEENIPHPVLANNDWVRLRVEVNDKGDAWFRIDQDQVFFREKAVDPTKLLCAAVGFDGRGIAYNGDLNWLYACQPRR